MKGKFIYKINAYSYNNKGFGKVLNKVANSLDDLIKTLDKKFKIGKNDKQNKK